MSTPLAIARCTLPLISSAPYCDRLDFFFAGSRYGGPRTVPHPGWRIESGALIVGRLKLIIGNKGPGVHFYPTYPNSTARPNASDPGAFGHNRSKLPLIEEIF